MMCNFKFKVILDASDTDTQEYYTKLIGQEIVLRHSTSRGSGKITTTNSESKDWIIDPVQFSKLGDSLILIHQAGYMLLKKNKNITLLTLEKLCIILDCTPNDIVRFTSN